MKNNLQHNLIFDFDGVLGDTFESTIRAKMIVDNQEYEQAQIETFRYFEKPSHNRDHEISDERLMAMRSWVKKFGQELNRVGFGLFEGFIEEISKIPNARLAIVSSGSIDYIKPKIDLIDLDFTHILSFEDHHSKEEKIEQICHDWGVDIRDVYYFTDANTDVLELENILDRTKIIGCSWGFLGHEKLSKVLPKNQIMDSYRDIHKVIEK